MHRSTVQRVVNLRMFRLRMSVRLCKKRIPFHGNDPVFCRRNALIIINLIISDDLLFLISNHFDCVRSGMKQTNVNYGTRIDFEMG